MIAKGFENRFSKGDIVYWCENSLYAGYHVMYGIVEDQYSDGVYVNLLDTKERRRIDGEPLEEFIINFQGRKRKKLPKGWSYDTKLFEETFDPWSPEEEKVLHESSIDKPDTIKKCYEMGIFVEKAKKFTGVIEADITNEGYRVIAHYPRWRSEEPTSRTIPSNRVYSSYEEVANEVQSKIAELKRQALLTDEEWSLEQIEKDVCRFLHFQWGFKNQEEIDRYMAFFKELPRVEDIETRLFGGMLQWKYEKNKTWRSAVLPD